MKTIFRSLCPVIVAFAWQFVATGNDNAIDFQRDVRPILSENCFHCHGPDEATRQAGLRLDQSESALTVIEPGDSESSELVRRILSSDPDEVMPPPDSKKSLSRSDRETLVQWIQQGGKFQQHWSLIPPKPSPAPELSDDTWSKNPIDRFVLKRLREANLNPSPDAELTTLVRRITLDLTGLPPSPSEVDKFIEAVSTLGKDLAVSQLTDRLFKSPAYAEHMTLPWLEAARYADTDGYQNDRYRYQHVWRDWVIDAFAGNMPYDQFLIEQIAGDLLPNATLRQQIATGFGRNHRINSEDGSIPEEWRTEYVADRVDTLGTAVMGLTVGCARCHDHKYDPISQRDYYQLFAYFNNIAEWGVGPNNGNSPPFIEVPASWPLLGESEDTAIAPEPVELRRARKEAGNGLQRPQAGSPSTVMVMHELDEPRQTFVLMRGQYDMPDREQRVQPDVPAALKQWDEDAADSDQPRDRLQLARWLTDTRHPLTTRVAVNRLWQQFFGVGIVASSDNFGSQGNPPSHPKLLDFLATQLMMQDWDLQKIQRMILSSATYQQSSRVSEEDYERDPENRWLARGPRVRMTAFMLRDQALAISGLLVRDVGGPSAKPYMPPKIWSSISNNKYEQDSGANLYRRSLYTYWRRTIPPPTMMNFNAAAREVCTVRTEPTNTPLQALTLMNNPVFVEAAQALANRMIIHTATVSKNESASMDSKLAIKHGFRLATSRSPSVDELQLLTSMHDQFLETFDCHPERAEEFTTKELIRENPNVIQPAQQAAMTLVASLILNLDETITKE